MLGKEIASEIYVDIESKNSIREKEFCPRSELGLNLNFP